MPEEQKKCADCDEPFTLSEGDQRFYEDKGLHLPRRCRSCRAAAARAILTKHREGGSDRG